MTADIVVRFTVEGWHHWPGATLQRSYLAHSHRHLFHVEVRLAVTHDDREVEFHDLLDYARTACPQGQLGAQSCEMIARQLCAAIRDRWPDRTVRVAVFEDGEVGAEVTVPSGRLLDPATWRPY